jgi:hypothetical protein
MLRDARLNPVFGNRAKAAGSGNGKSFAQR